MAIGNAKDVYDDTLLEDEVLDDDEEENAEENGDESEESEDGEQENDEDEDEDGEDDEAEDGESDKTTDKKEVKIVSQKRELKQAYKRIEELERKRQEEDIDKKIKTKRDTMINEGYSETDVDEYIGVFKKLELLELEKAEREWKDLKRKYPTIGAFSAQIMEVKRTLPEASLEDIFLTKFSKESAYDQKTRIQQEMLYKKEQSKSKGNGSMTGSGSKSKDVVTKLSPSDEEAYQILKKSNPAMTRKLFAEIDSQDELT